MKRDGCTFAPVLPPIKRNHILRSRSCQTKTGSFTLGSTEITGFQEICGIITTMIALLILGGLVTGALVNLCADSLPTKRRLRTPACAYCGQPRPAVAWSAVAAYLTGRQRCPSCAAPLSLRHVLVELGTTLLYVLIWLQMGTSSTTALHILYGSVFILVIVTDLEHRLILHVVMLPAIGLALVGAFIDPAFDSPKRALLGGAIGLVSGLALYLAGGLFTRALGRMRGRCFPRPTPACWR